MRVVSIGRDKTVRVWRTQDLKLLRVIPVPSEDGVMDRPGLAEFLRSRREAIRPADVHLPDPPPVDVLRMLLQDKGSAPGARDVVAWLVGLDETHRRLRHYDEAVRKACAEATDELVRSYCSRPTGCLVAVPHEP